MSDQSCLAVICGGCCVFLFSAFEPWCNTKRYGCGCCGDCGGPRGCCHSCFDDGFNRDAWDEEDAQRVAKAGIATKEAKPDEVTEQPVAVAEMERPAAEHLPVEEKPQAAT